MSRARQDLGRRGEAIARAHIESHGYAIVAANYRSKAGEIDLVTEKEGAIVFITSTKRTHLIATAQAYLQQHAAHDRQWRIDLVAVEFNRNRPPQVRIIENAIEL